MTSCVRWPPPRHRPGHRRQCASLHGQPYGHARAAARTVSDAPLPGLHAGGQDPYGSVGPGAGTAPWYRSCCARPRRCARGCPSTSAQSGTAGLACLDDGHQRGAGWVWTPSGRRRRRRRGRTEETASRVRCNVSTVVCRVVTTAVLCGPTSVAFGRLRACGPTSVRDGRARPPASPPCPARTRRPPLKLRAHWAPRAPRALQRAAA